MRRLPSKNRMFWCRWFETPILWEVKLPAVLVVMAWVFAHADGDGTVGFDPDQHHVIARETGSAATDIADALKWMFAKLLLVDVDTHSSGIRTVAASEGLRS
jgi:hypothetical protein